MSFPRDRGGGPKRIVSLLPGATEIVAALGAGDRLVGVSHECDYPAWVRDLPRVTWTPIDTEASSGAIDEQIRAAIAAGQPAIVLDAGILATLRPDLILTQSLCQVCAVADGSVFQLAELLTPAPAVLALTGRTLAGVHADMIAIARTLDLEHAGEELVAELAARFAALRARAARHERPRVLCVEWLEPPFVAGHWVPELVDAAGGVDVAAAAGSHSRVVTWDELDRTPADVVIVMLCGFDLRRARVEVAMCEGLHRFADRGLPIWLLDGNAYTSRPGPRLIEGAECIAAALKGALRPGLEPWRR